MNLDFSRRQSVLSLIIAGFIALSIGVYFRLYPLTSFTADDSSEKAALFVMAKLKILASQQVAARYPNAPAHQKDVLAEKLFSEMIKSKKENVRQSIESVSQSINDTYAPEQEYPYLLASDSFYYNCTQRAY